MTIDFSQPIKNLNGTEAKDVDGNVLRLWNVAVKALLNAQDKTKAEDKVKRFKLAQQLHEAKSVKLKVDDVKLIKDLVGEAFGPLVVGQAFEMLDPELHPAQNGVAEHVEA